MQTTQQARRDEPVQPLRHTGAASETVRTVEARSLLGARGLLRIDHDGELYTLRLTKNNRLILTK